MKLNGQAFLIGGLHFVSKRAIQEFEDHQMPKKLSIEVTIIIVSEILFQNRVVIREATAELI